MITEFTSRFSKDLDKLHQASVKNDILEIIGQVEKSTQLSEISNIKKLKGHPTAYRIHCGDYRIGFYFEQNVVQFSRLAHRKDIYKVFP